MPQQVEQGGPAAIAPGSLFIAADSGGPDKGAHNTTAFASHETLIRAEPWDEAVVGQSASMQTLFSAIKRLSASDAPVLLAGEAGTGKQLVARTIHHHSARSQRLLVTVDCSAQDQVLALCARFSDGAAAGFKVLPAEGTIFLKNQDKMPVPLQKKFCQVLAKPVSRKPGRSVRLIASTQVLEPEDKLGELFDPQLMEAFTILKVPALRDRLEDLFHLGRYFLTRFATSGRAPKVLSPIVTNILMQYNWPSNVRELQMVLHQCSANAKGDMILLGDLPDSLLNAVGPSFNAAADGTRSGGRSDLEPPDVVSIARDLFRWARTDLRFKIIPSVERELIVQAMEETRGNQAHSAKLLGISRATLRKRLDRLNIQRKVSFR
jgi:two-component system nitrogen regulation response regulator GlnG